MSFWAKRRIFYKETKTKIINIPKYRYNINIKIINKEVIFEYKKKKRREKAYEKMCLL